MMCFLEVFSAWNLQRERERDPLSNEGCLGNVYFMNFLGNPRDIFREKVLNKSTTCLFSASSLAGGEASKDALSEASVPGELSVPADGPRPPGTLGSTSLVKCLVFHLNLLVLVAVF